MIKSRFICYVTVFIILEVTSTNLYASCNPPKPPTLPDPQTAVLAEMVKAQKEVKKFIALGESYLGCTKDRRVYNNMVDLMRSVGSDFNKKIKDFRALKKK